MPRGAHISKGLTALLVPLLTVPAAASLGALGSTPAAAGEVVAVCVDDGITAGYVTGYVGGTTVVTAVELSNVNGACDGETGTVVLRNGSETLAVATGHGAAVVDGRVTVALPAPVPAASIVGLSVTITG